jgi:hypothetical protein
LLLALGRGLKQILKTIFSAVMKKAARMKNMRVRQEARMGVLLRDRMGVPGTWGEFQTTVLMSGVYDLYFGNCRISNTHNAGSVCCVM